MSATFKCYMFLSPALISLANCSLLSLHSFPAFIFFSTTLLSSPQQIDNHTLAQQLHEDSNHSNTSTNLNTSANTRTKRRTALPISGKNNCKKRYLESARSWVQGPLFAEGLRNSQDKEHPSSFLSGITRLPRHSSSDGDVDVSSSLTVADVLVQWMEKHDTTHPNFKVGRSGLCLCLCLPPPFHPHSLPSYVAQNAHACAILIG